MIFRNVERVEVIEISFDFTSVLNRISQRNKDVFDAFPNDSDRMKMSPSWTPAGKRDVYGFAFAAGDFQTISR